MEIFKPTGKRHFLRWAGVFISALACLLFVWNPHESRAENERVVTIYHDGVEQTVVTDATTVKEALERTHITLNKYDAVEPARDTQLVAPTYSVNVFRARPVAVIDGQERYQIMSPHTSARKIAETAGLKVYDEDSFDLARIDDFLGEDGVGLKLTIDRSVPIVFNLYGKRLEIRTQAQTVGALLKDKNVVLGSNDGASLPLDAPILTHMELNVWRNGVQTVTEEKEVPFATEFIRDTDRDIGYREVKTPGKKGKKQVMFEIELRDGQEVSRKEIHSVVTEQPTKQVEVIGVKNIGFSGPFQEALARLRMCEAGGRYDRNSGNGYYGAYQFNLTTWRGAAPDGYKDMRPDQAPPEAQDRAAHNLYMRRGWQPWPGCTAKLGLQDIYR